MDMSQTNDIQKQELFNAASDLEYWMSKNCGDNADFPIEIIAHGKDSSTALIKRLNRLGRIIRHIHSSF